MIFNSYDFFLFFAAVILMMKALRPLPRVQKVALLAAGNIFYGYWDWRFLSLLWVSILIDYFIAHAIGKTETTRRRKLLVSVSIISNLTILGFFKYFDFFQDSLGNLLNGLGIPFSPITLGIILPIGISFYTFQSLSYSIDVYRRQVEPCRDLLTFAQYVSYFPQLVAGPIERASRLIPQLSRPVEIRAKNLCSGFFLIVWGLFKKAVAADLAGTFIVDPIFLGPESGAHLWLASIAFGFQIYLDFSGYCDIARGTSRCLGIKLMDNFHAPYAAQSIAGFWRRWHISLSTWFRDYLYIPLGGNRSGKGRTYFNLAITMILCGLWHGASAAFLIWGAYHGALLILHRSFDRTPAEKPSFSLSSWLLTFLCVVFGWMIFRAEAINLADYAVMLSSPAAFLPADLSTLTSLIASLVILALPVAAAHWVQIQAARGREIEDLIPSPVLSGASLGVLIFLVFLLGSLAENVPFIYFQF